MDYLVCVHLLLLLIINQSNWLISRTSKVTCFVCIESTESATSSFDTFPALSCSLVVKSVIAKECLSLSVITVVVICVTLLLFLISLWTVVCIVLLVNCSILYIR